MKTATLLLASLTFASLGNAQDHKALEDAKGPAPFVAPAGEEELTKLIDRCAAYLQRNILYSHEELTTPKAGPVLIKLQQPVTTDRDGCEVFLSQMLYRAGFALTQMDEKGTMLEVISLQGPRAREISQRAVMRAAEDVLARPDLRVPVTVVLKLENTNATIATNALRPFFASAGASSSPLLIGNVGNNTAMLLSGMQDQVAQAIRIVRASDVPGGKEWIDIEQRLAVIAARLDALEGKNAEKK